MKKYKFRFNDSTYIDFTEEKLKNAQNVDFIDDNSKGKLFYVNREDNKQYMIIIPLDMIEEVLDE